MRLFNYIERHSQNCSLPSDFGTRELFVSVAPEPISPTCHHGTNMRGGNLIVLSLFSAKFTYYIYTHCCMCLGLFSPFAK